MKITIQTHTTLADTTTPIIAYQRIREVYAKSILFECATYQDAKNSNSIIVFDELASIDSTNGKVVTRVNDIIQQEIESTSYDKNIQSFLSLIDFNQDPKNKPYLGVYGFTGYNSVSTMEDVKFSKHANNLNIPDFHYGFYRFTLVFHHHTNTMTILECIPKNETSMMKDVMTLLQKNSTTTYSFETIGEETCNSTNEEFLKMVAEGKRHAQIGDTFQLVLSRQFSQTYTGDDFNVYRTLRSLNPSPYLFYADFGSFKLLGSSPEAQIVISNEIAEIHPIAGTFKRTGDEKFDAQETKRLREDEKENAEHVMLVDLARNDLSRHCKNVEVKSYKQIQTFSHVIHLVSLVTGEKLSDSSSLAVFSDTFPAGTLSGAPKIKAMNLINQYEKTDRSFYGGAIGSFSFNGDINHAIIIRSFCSKDNQLHYQAGAGVVINSQPENELMEVSNKLGALRKAIDQATNIHKKSFAL
jgi:anthranilate synthase component 1